MGNTDSDRLFIAGHSSGGHVGSMIVMTNWTEVHGSRRGFVKGRS